MKVLVAVDGFPEGRSFVDAAVELLRPGLEAVWLLHVAEPEPDFVGYGVDPPVMRQQTAEGLHREHRALQAMAEALRDQGLAATALLVQGEAAEVIAQEADKLAVDLVVLGAHKTGPWRRLWRGDVDPDGLALAGRPVLLMPP